MNDPVLPPARWAGRTPPAYRTAHRGVVRDHGPARAFRCVRCARRAAHWALDNDSPRVVVAPGGHRWSPDPTDYRPLCAPCHARLDAAWRARTADPAQLALFAASARSDWAVGERQ